MTIGRLGPGRGGIPTGFGPCVPPSAAVCNHFTATSRGPGAQKSRAENADASDSAMKLAAGGGELGETEV